MDSISSFSGFTKKTLEFYSGLAGNNNKAWFEAHKREYEDNVLRPAREFIVSLGGQLESLHPGINAIPQVNQSIFRIYRDTRFSRDKTPYKTNLALWFWEGPGPRMECSGYYLSIEPSLVMAGAGIYLFPKYMLQEFRDSLVHPVHGASFRKIMAGLEKKSYHPGGKYYKKTPRGYDPDHENAEYLLYNGLWIGVEGPVPGEFFSAAFVNHCFRMFREMSPLHAWLTEMVGRAGTGKK